MLPECMPPKQDLSTTQKMYFYSEKKSFHTEADTSYDRTEVHTYRKAKLIVFCSILLNIVQLSSLTIISYSKIKKKERLNFQC